MSDQHVTVQVGPIASASHVRRSRNCTRGLGHTADHNLHIERASQRNHLVSLAHTGTLHQFDVDTREYTLQLRNVDQTLARLISDGGQRRVLSNPSHIVEVVLADRLLDEDKAVLLAPMDHLQSVVLVLPALVCINAQRLGRLNRADSTNQLLVLRSTQLNLNQVVRCSLLGLLANNLRSIDTDRERGIGSLHTVVTPDVVPRLTDQLTNQVVQCDIDRSLRCGVERGQVVNLEQNIFEQERRRILIQNRLNTAQECHCRLRRLAQIGRHSSLTITLITAVLDLGQHDGGMGTGVTRNGEGVSQRSVSTPERQLHLLVADRRLLALTYRCSYRRKCRRSQCGGYRSNNARCQCLLDKISSFHCSVMF